MAVTVTQTNHVVMSENVSTHCVTNLTKMNSSQPMEIGQFYNKANT